MMDFKDEYINKSEAILAVTQDGCTANVVGVLYHLPAADVVPKSEVDRVYYNLRAVLEERAETKREIAREIFEEIESISSDFPIYGNVNTVILSERDLAFIKKKYTEDVK